MENVETIRKYREFYKYNKSNPNDEVSSIEYSSEITLYTVTSKAIQESCETAPKSKDILSQLDELQEKKEYPYARVF